MQYVFRWCDRPPENCLTSFLSWRSAIKALQTHESRRKSELGWRCKWLFGLCVNVKGLPALQEHKLNKTVSGDSLSLLLLWSRWCNGTDAERADISVQRWFPEGDSLQKCGAQKPVWSSLLCRSAFHSLCLLCVPLRSRGLCWKRAVPHVVYQNFGTSGDSRTVIGFCHQLGPLSPQRYDPKAVPIDSVLPEVQLLTVLLWEVL